MLRPQNVNCSSLLLHMWWTALIGCSVLCHTSFLARSLQKSCSCYTWFFVTIVPKCMIRMSNDCVVCIITHCHARTQDHLIWSEILSGKFVGFYWALMISISICLYHPLLRIIALFYVTFMLKRGHTIKHHPWPYCDWYDIIPWLLCLVDLDLHWYLGMIKFG